MADYISREAAIKAAKCHYPKANEMIAGIILVPAADVVARDCYDRILAENETMREMLARIGKKCGDSMDDVRQVDEISDAVYDAMYFLNSVSAKMPYHVYSALFDLISGICPNCGCQMNGGRK